MFSTGRMEAQERQDHLYVASEMVENAGTQRKNRTS